MFRTIALSAVLSLNLSVGGASGCRATQNSNSQGERPVTSEQQKTSSGEIKVLAEGFQSAITNPFVAVVRDADTYAALRKLDSNLPRLNSDFFQTTTVVAAFLGERNTGGYSVEITPDASGIRIGEHRPGKDMMVTQVITSPFKVVALEGVGNSPVWLSLDDAWKQRTQPYRVSSGKFVMSGGFTGSSQEFGLQGSVAVVRESNLATLQVRLISVETAKERTLVECVSGIVGSDSQIKISRMSAGSLISPPSNGLQATGTFGESGKKFSLSLWGRPPSIPDGYSGQGSIEAELSETPVKP